MIGRHAATKRASSALAVGACDSFESADSRAAFAQERLGSPLRASNSNAHFNLGRLTASRLSSKLVNLARARIEYVAIQ